MKKSKNIEMKIYELLGVKVFKKIVMKLLYIVITPLTVNLSEEEKNIFFM